MLAPIDNAIGFIGNLKLTGHELVRAEEIYQDLISFRGAVRMVEDTEGDQGETTPFIETYSE